MITAKHFVYVDSRSRINGTDSNFSYLINLPPNESYDRVVVLNAQIPKSYYLVEAPANTFILIEGASTVTVTVPSGDYVLQAWMYTLQSLLNTNSPSGWTYTVTYPSILTSPNTGKLTFSVSGNAGIQPSITVSSQFFEQFGFNSASVNTFVSDALTSSNVIKLQVEDRLFITSDIVEGTTNTCVLQSINSAPSPDYSSIQYHCFAPEFYSKPLRSQYNQVYNFSLTDENGKVLETNGLNITMTLLFYKESDIVERLKAFMKLAVGTKG